MVQKSVYVPKELHGKVIGKGWATKKDIESDYGVTLTFPAKNDPNACHIVIDGPTNDSVGYAEARILDICGLDDDTEEDAARERVQKLRQEKDECFRQAFAAPHGPVRDAMFVKANAAKEKCEQAEWEVAKEIFASKNQGYGDDQMDLHGLRVSEAERFVNERLDKVQDRLRNDSSFVLSIITGIGNHSTNNVAKIKPAIKDLLRNRGFHYQEDQTGGILLVNGSGAPIPSASAPSRPPQRPAQTPEDNIAVFFDMVFELLACCFGGGKQSHKGK